MSSLFRIFLIMGALIMFIIIIRKIKKSSFKIEDSIFWILFAILILLLSIFPEIAFWGAAFLGIESPTNLVFLIVIFILITRSFSLTEKVSTLSIKLEEMAIKNAQLHKDDKK